MTQTYWCRRQKCLNTFEMSVDQANILSQSLPGQFYEGPSSIPRRVPVGRECDPHQAFSKVKYVSKVRGQLCDSRKLYIASVTIIQRAGNSTP